MCCMQDALELAGFTLNPRAGQFDAVLSIVCTGVSGGVWRFGYSPAHLMWRKDWYEEPVLANMSSSACNKLDEALRTCGFANGEIDVRAPFSMLDVSIRICGVA
jgi:hypothetical protein